jgi:hypothetical protein
MKNLFALIRLHLLALLALGLTVTPAAAADTVPQWGIYEIELNGPTNGNPFLDVRLSAVFSNGSRSIEVPGFYDGDGVYRIRFMPDQPGVWHYETRANRWLLTKRLGSCTVTTPAAGNHGPVRVHNTYHFAYADGTVYYPVGTTCYNWLQAPDDWQEQTLKTLADAPFNKLRFLVFPQNRDFKDNSVPKTPSVPPTLFPFEGKPRKDWDYTRFSPEFFQKLEQRVGQLRDLGIEADVILFSPYCSSWGFDKMDAATDDRYLRYITARLSAYRNVWWSMANEFDHLKTKNMADWDRFFQVVQKADPYDHLRSIHNGYAVYDNNQPWVTHASLQNSSAVRHPGHAAPLRDKWHKPVVFDEVNYEGNETRRWGQLTPEEMIRRIWLGTADGTYVEHGECYLNTNDTWLSYGGVLRGGSPPRIAFLRKILESVPGYGLDPLATDPGVELGGQPGKYYLFYFDNEMPASWSFALPHDGLADGMKFHVDVIDTWEMTITPVDGVFTLKEKDSHTFVDRDDRTIKLPDKPYMALRITPVKS